MRSKTLKSLIVLASLLCILCMQTERAAGSDRGADSPAANVIARFLEMPHPEQDRLGKARSARLEILAELKSMPDSAVPAIQAALPKIDRPEQRAELAGALRNFMTKASADVLVGLLKDTDEHVRGKAIRGLRLMARRVDRSGGKRVQRGPTISPKVEGLVPHLIAAARDESETVRISAVYALADTLDPAAIKELRRKVNDMSRKVRLKAACLLTEFDDSYGLPEMKRALHGLRKESVSQLAHNFESEILLASFERITGKSFGPIPSSSVLSSDRITQIHNANLTRAHLAKWAAYWNEKSENETGTILLLGKNKLSGTSDSSQAKGPASTNVFDFVYCLYCDLAII